MMIVLTCMWEPGGTLMGGGAMWAWGGGAAISVLV